MTVIKALFMSQASINKSIHMQYKKKYSNASINQKINLKQFLKSKYNYIFGDSISVIDFVYFADLYQDKYYPVNYFFPL